MSEYRAWRSLQARSRWPGRFGEQRFELLGWGRFFVWELALFPLEDCLIADLLSVLGHGTRY
jgi:hypothetical protein